MKIRIKGSSIRIRLSKTEVTKMVQEGSLQETTLFPSSIFSYALIRTQTGDKLSATFQDGRITMFVPSSLIQHWDTNSVISIESKVELNAKENLHLLLEKDFQCLDEVIEDQSDNYTNPNKTC